MAFSMFARLQIPALLACLLSCSSGANNFGGRPDAGDAASDAADTGDAAGDTLLAVGSPCSGPSECVAGALCIGTVAGAFECMRRCDVAYVLCEAGSVCLPVMTQDAAICYTGGTANETESCQNNLDCGSGLLCFGASGQFYCQPACGEVDDCRADQMCLRLDSGAGLCRNTVGAACVSGAECAAGLVCSDDGGDLSGRLPGGYCTSSCQRDTDCPTDAVCRAVVGGAQRACLATCTHRSQCRFNGQYDCLDATVCAASTDPGACQAMFGEDSLCVPGPL